MKAIFAVTALAAAISTQAFAADTETEVSYLGSMDAFFQVDLLDDGAKTVGLTEDDDDGEGVEIAMETTIVHGPFSGSLGLEYYSEDDDAAIIVGDIIITDGNLSFGQVGSLMSTDEYAGDMLDYEPWDDDEDADQVADVAAGFKYMVMEGFYVQLQGTDEDGADYGVAAQYTGSSDALSYVVEGEAQLSDVSGVDDEYFFGAGVTYSVDAFTAAAAVNHFYNNGLLEDDGVTSAPGQDTEYALEISADVAGASLYAGWTDYSTETEDDEFLELTAAYAVTETITAGVGYEYTTAEDAGDYFYGTLAYAEGQIAASLEAGLEDFDAETTHAYIFADVVYTSEAGVAYYTEFERESSSDATTLTMGGRYSF
ncbi:hypothetical protein [Reinekea marinisedimentorum]|uniref:Porin n=1 Tax=Reinekea marinisedimentorum TaxID=230495 RepID=A0A4R3IEM2_9GAMM|nr:hypothetical protein [Reinekea marinisedimentorum]TCS43241.1 hypothetical protein BCF53_102267 [Reinekea marinisedimentorum]